MRGAALWLSVLMLASAASADVLELRDGRRLEGRFLDGTAQALRFESGGTIQAIPVAEVGALRFGDLEAGTATPALASPASAAPAAAAAAPAAAAAAAPAAPAPASAATPSPRTLQVPAGTRLRVRLTDTVDPRLATEGDRFGALLEADLVAGGVVIAPALSRVYGLVSEAHSTGPVEARLQLELSALMIGGRMVPIVTGTQQVAEAAAGAAPPASAAPRPASGRLPSGSIFEFRLLQPLEVQVQ